MGIGGFFKKVGGGIWKGAKVAVPIADTFGLGAVVPYLGLIRVAMRIAEKKGTKDKMEIALGEIMPALEQAGVNLPVKDVRLAVEILLNKSTNGLPGEDEVWTFNTEEE